MRDLSHDVVSGMPVYPGDPEVEISDALTLEADGVAVSHVRIGSHSGTHLDAPSHTVPGGRTLDQIGLHELVGEALILHVSTGARQAIGAQDLRFEDGDRSRGIDELERVPSIVALATGWDRFFGSPDYLAHPFVAPETADLLWELGMRVLAVDTLSPDATPSMGFPVHEIVLGRDGLIVENLTGLSALGSTARIGFFPLKLGGIDGAPVRAVAFESE